jgi:hypothetical protein
VSEVRQAALEYGRRGWRVLPLHAVDHLGECTCGDSTCKSPAKHPRTADGVKSASADPAQIAEWWGRWPSANVGIATGPESGLWVLDLDHSKPGEADGLDAVLALEPAASDWAAIVVTGSHGRHLYYAWPADGVEVRSRARVLEHDGRKASADTRGIGGYVVAPPSVHASGRVYAWEQPRDELVPAPRRLLRAVTQRRETAPAPAGGPLVAWEAEDVSRAGRYVEGALRRACERVAASVSGGRHAAILREGETLGGWVHLGVCEAETMVAQLAAAAVAAGVGEAEALRTARDAVAHGQERPRGLPEGQTRTAPAGPAWDDETSLDDGDDDWGVDDYVPGTYSEPEELDPELSGVRVLGRPQIVVSGRQPRDVVTDARRALADLSGPGRLYLRDGRIVQVVVTEHGPAIREVGTDQLTACLLDAADLVELRRPRAREATAGEALLEEPAKAVPGYLLPAILGTRDEWLPLLSRVATAPYYDAEGRLVDAEGYDAGSRGYLAEGLVRERLTLEQALGHIDDWIGQFPFVGPADRAHAIAFALTPIVRELIHGPVPMTVFEAPSPGTGKSLLMQVLASAATGRPVEPTPMSSQEDERRKALGSMLSEGRPVVLLDNVRGHLHDPALEGVLTSYPTWSDRRMGGQERLRVPATAVWGLSGNNLTMNADLARRTVTVRLDARCARPEARTGWRHADLLRWTADHRDRLLSALLTLVQTWQLEGRPWGTATLGSYEAWARVIGGILAACGVPGLLTDRDTRAETADPETAEWIGLMRLWTTEISLRGRRAAGEIARACSERGLLLGVLGDGNANSQARRMGAALAKQRGRVFDLGGGVEVEVVAAAILHGSPTHEIRRVDRAATPGQVLPFG